MWDIIFLGCLFYLLTPVINELLSMILDKLDRKEK